jgi:hypothetical protein
MSLGLAANDRIFSCKDLNNSSSLSLILNWSDGLLEKLPFGILWFSKSYLFENLTVYETTGVYGRLRIVSVTYSSNNLPSFSLMKFFKNAVDYFEIFSKFETSLFSTAGVYVVDEDVASTG